MNLPPTCHDHRKRRCPRLGHDITFAYCNTCDTNQRPCFKILDCWWEIFEVADFLSQILPKEEFERLLQPQIKPKITSLLELIEQAKQNSTNRE